MNSKYETLSTANKNLVNEFIDFLLVKQQKNKEETLEAMCDADEGRTIGPFSSIDDLTKALDAESSIITDARKAVQEKEVQAMILAEEYAAADMNAALNYREEVGGNKKLYSLVSKGKLSIKDAAEEAKVSEEVFRNNMLACGYKLP